MDRAEWMRIAYGSQTRARVWMRARPDLALFELIELRRGGALLVSVVDFDIGKPRTTRAGGGMEWWQDSFDVGAPCPCLGCYVRARVFELGGVRTSVTFGTSRHSPVG